MITLTWGLKPFAAIETELRAIPIEETSLDASVNNLHQKRFNNYITRFFDAIPVHITSLNLSYNCLYDLTVDELSAIPAGITSLNLKGNDFGNQDGPRLEQTFAAVSVGRSTLNLSESRLWRITTEELVPALKAISLSVTDLNLGSNGLFYQKSSAESALILQAIPVSVTTLDISGNHFEKLTINDMTQLRGLLPHVKTIYLSYDEVSGMDDTKRNALRELYPNLVNTIFLDKSNKILGVPGMEKPPIVTSNPIQCVNLAKRLGFPAEAPSLQTQAAFFAKKNEMDVTELPQHIQNIVKKV